MVPAAGAGPGRTRLSGPPADTARVSPPCSRGRCLPPGRGDTHTQSLAPGREGPRFALGLLLGGTSEDRELLGLKLSCLLCPASIRHGGPHRLTPPAGQATPPRPQGSWSIRTRGAMGSASNWGQLLAAGSGAWVWPPSLTAAPPQPWLRAPLGWPHTALRDAAWAASGRSL